MNEVLFLLLLITLYNLFEYYKEHLLFNQISGINNNDIYSYDLFDVLNSQTRNLDIHYKITDNEREYIWILLHSFREYMNTLYFRKKLSDKIKILLLSERDYLFYSLYLYLNSHINEIYFKDDIAYRVFSADEYTPFGVAYQKTQLIVLYYCGQSKALLKIDPAYKYQYDNAKQYFDDYIIKTEI